MTASEAVEALERHHGSSFTPDQLADYIWFFEKSNDIDAIVTRWKFKNGPGSRFPAPSQLFTVAEEVRVDAAQKIKKSEPTIYQLKNKVKSEHGKRAIAGIIKCLNSKVLDRPGYIAWMNEMELSYPGVGWKEQAVSLQKFWDDEPERHKKSAEFWHQRSQALLEGGQR